MDKAPDAFRTISEVAADLDLPQHVLRFWESKFPQVRPLKRAGGRRYYRPDDVELLRAIQRLLYKDGYTIRGVQRILREQGVRGMIALALGDESAAAHFQGDEREDYDFDDGEDGPPEEPAPRVLSTRRDPVRARAEPSVLTPEPAPSALAREKKDRVPRDVRVDDEGSGRASAFRFLERLRGDGPPRPAGDPSADSHLSREDIRALQATLFELLECKRLLDQTR
ncbi:MerR family transcriptional regulator [Segnochrobactraceae bacterium EtOH-i3]